MLRFRNFPHSASVGFKKEADMLKRELIIGGALAALLCGCGSSAEDRADENLQETVKESTAELSTVAAKVPDVKQANEIVDEAVDLSVAEKKAEEAEHKAK
jgi:hypothetical protein